MDSPYLSHRFHIPSHYPLAFPCRECPHPRNTIHGRQQLPFPFPTNKPISFYGLYHSFRIRFHHPPAVLLPWQSPSMGFHPWEAAVAALPITEFINIPSFFLISSILPLCRGICQCHSHKFPYFHAVGSPIESSGPCFSHLCLLLPWNKEITGYIAPRKSLNRNTARITSPLSMAIIHGKNRAAIYAAGTHINLESLSRICPGIEKAFKTPNRLIPLSMGLIQGRNPWEGVDILA